MTDQEHEILLTERAETLGLKKRTYDLFVNILADNADDKEFFRGYNPEEIIPEFDGYEYIGMIAHIQNMNAKLPIEYLNRSHIHYEFVSYLSMVGTLFVSKQFESAGQSIMSAYRYIETVDAAKFDKDHLWE